MRTLDLQNEVAEAGLSEIQRQIESQVRSVWADQGRDSAKALAADGLKLFNDSTLLLELNAEIMQASPRSFDLHCKLLAEGKVCAEGVVTAIQVDAAWMRPRR